MSFTLSSSLLFVFSLHYTLHLNLCFSFHRSVMCTIINALSLALMDAGVAMVDMISACSVGFVKNEFCLDVTQLEQNTGGAYIPIVIKARSDEIVFMQLDSRLSLDNLQQAMDRGVEGCKLVKDYIEAAIRKEKS